MVLIFMSNDRGSIKVFRMVSRRVLCSSLGFSSGKAILFFLKEALGRDPFEVLWENPKAFYDEIVKVFGDGAKILISILVENINLECGLSMSPEHFIEIIQSENQSSLEEIRSFIRMVAESGRRT